MSYLGDFRIGKTVRKMWNSNAVAGESITRATNGTVSVYKDGGTTQSTSGVTDTEDFDGLTGVHLVAVDTSSDGTFYSAGSDFEVVLSGATIDGKAINATLFAFSLENRSHLMPTTDGRKLDVSAGGEAGIDWANIGSPTTAVNLSATNIDVDQVVASVSGAVASVTAAVTVGTINANVVNASALAADAVTEIQSGLATAASLATVATYIDTEVAAILAAVDTEVGAIKAKTDNLPADPASETTLATLATAANLATVDTVVDGIKAKTDSLTFTNAGVVDSNITHVISDPVQTNGAADTNWGGTP